MQKNNLAAVTPAVTPGIEPKKEDQLVVALTAKPPAEIEDTLARSAANKGYGLAGVVRHSQSVAEKAAILFTSAYFREGAPSLAFRTARLAAIQSEGKVLYIHASERVPNFFRDIKNSIPVSLQDFVNKKERRNVIPFVVLKDSGLVCAHYGGTAESVKKETLQALVASVQKCFEFVIIGGDNLLDDGTSAAFSQLVDGVIVVAEAEKTRAPVARRLKQTIEENGGKVIGAILNRRKYYIPGWIYRMLYGGCR
jgi:protein-tyrosine kinase